MMRRLVAENFENHLVHLILDLLIKFRGCTHFFFPTTPSSICASSFSSTQPVLWPNNQLPCHSTSWLQKDQTSTNLLRKNIAPSGDTVQYYSAIHCTIILTVQGPLLSTETFMYISHCHSSAHIHFAVFVKLSSHVHCVTMLNYLLGLIFSACLCI